MKKLIAFTMVIMVVFLLASCGDSNNRNEIQDLRDEVSALRKRVKTLENAPQPATYAETTTAPATYAAAATTPAQTTAATVATTPAQTTAAATRAQTVNTTAQTPATEATTAAPTPAMEATTTAPATYGVEATTPAIYETTTPAQALTTASREEMLYLHNNAIEKHREMFAQINNDNMLTVTTAQTENGMITYYESNDFSKYGLAYPKIIFISDNNILGEQNKTYELYFWNTYYSEVRFAFTHKNGANQERFYFNHYGELIRYINPYGVVTDAFCENPDDYDDTRYSYSHFIRDNSEFSNEVRESAARLTNIAEYVFLG